MKTPHITSLRASFPMLTQRLYDDRPLIYLDHAATSQKPQCVIDAVSNFYASHYGTPHRSAHHAGRKAVQHMAQVRSQVQHFIGAKEACEVIFTSSTTAGLNMVVNSYRQQLDPGEEVIISPLAHHACRLPWQHLCKERGATLTILPLTAEGTVSPELLQNHISDKTKIVALTHASNVLGSINPVAKLTEIAHDHGAVAVVDAAQSLGHLPIDVEALGCDFLIFSAHKMYGPTGIGILYGQREKLEQLLPTQLGGGMVEEVTKEAMRYAPLPYRLEAGTPHMAGIAGLGAAITFLAQLPMQELMDYEAKLHDYMCTELRRIPRVQLLPLAAERLGVTSFTLEGAHLLDIAMQLDAEGIALRAGDHCARPLMDYLKIPGTLRASLGLYNNAQDIDALVGALRKLVG